ncbi:MAG: YcaO-like family protein [Coxiellaceae bacterium]|nr:YcaO-like family protein [Coxiellaceae bacterium]
MTIKRLDQPSGCRYNTDVLQSRMVDKLCGLIVELGVIAKSSADPRLLNMGSYLTGVHRLLNQKDPGRGGYHIGGAGVLPNEATIKNLAESVERYCQLLAMRDAVKHHAMRFTSYNALIDAHESVVPLEYLTFFSDEQLRRKGFIYKAFQTDQELQWIKLPSLVATHPIWCPVQLLFVGYNINRSLGELSINTAVTTGTAVHTTYPLAIRSALLEKIQIDSVMGHWYSNYSCYEIALDHRTEAMTKVINKYFAKATSFNFQFYWLPNPDLAGFSIACVITRKHSRSLPAVSIGLGADTALEPALYKALLEAIAGVDFARMEIFKQKYLQEDKRQAHDANTMFDLDENVSFYAKGLGNDAIAKRFFSAATVCASDLPEDMKGTIGEQNTYLLDSFKASNKDIVYIDLTTPEAKALGLVAVRVWSPHTLSLCLPSAPPLLHPRFSYYGGVAHQYPHPYP